MASKELIDKVELAEKLIATQGDKEEYADALYQYGRFIIETEKDREYGLYALTKAKGCYERIVSKLTNGGTIWTLDEYCKNNNVEYEILTKYYDVIKEECLDNFESFMFYMEKKRPYSKRFYLPRRKTLQIVARDLEDLENRVIEFYGLSMPSRVGKSTICIFFLAWVMLKRPNSHSAMGGHSGILAKGFYKELMNLITTDEYTFQELFAYFHPEYNGKKFPTNNSADEFTITLGDPDRFATVTCRGIDGTWTGAVDVSKDGYLYVDDLVRDREHSLSPLRMNNTYQEYLNKMVDRKNDGARELMVGTLWNVLDPLNRMKEDYGDNTKYRFRKIPALDDNDESNFQYTINGFSTEYYRNMREKLDNAEWMAKFQQSPYVREGIVFSADTLRFFNGILPKNKKYELSTVCDVAFGGGDSVSMPIGLKDVETDLTYIIGWLHDNRSVQVTIPRVAKAIMSFGIKNITVEKNNGGALYADKIREELEKNGYSCYIETKPAPNNISKTDKILGEEDRIKEKFIFLDNTYINPEDYNDDEFMVFNRDADYNKAMDEMYTFVRIGKTLHDDSSDSIAQLSIKTYGDVKRETRLIRGGLF